VRSIDCRETPIPSAPVSCKVVRFSAALAKYARIGPKTLKKAEVYFRIGEAARILRMSASSLRNWERIELVIPTRTRARYWLYSREALSKLRKIQYLRIVKGVNPAGIAAMLRNEVSADAPEPLLAQQTKRSGIADRLVRLRHELGLTLSGVASQTGVSVSFLSSPERGYSSASIATLQKLAKLYRTNVLSFFADEENSRRLVRSHDRKVLKPNEGVEMDLLASGNKMMEPHRFASLHAPEAEARTVTKAKSSFLCFRESSRSGWMRSNVMSSIPATACTLKAGRRTAGKTSARGRHPSCG